MKKYFIYALIHPVSRKPFYVGSTSMRLCQRLGDHVHDAKNNSRLKVHVYISTLGQRPFIEMLDSNECTTKVDARKQELYWIERLRSEGHELYNAYRPYDPNGKINRQLSNVQ